MHSNVQLLTQTDSNGHKLTSRIKGAVAKASHFYVLKGKVDTYAHMQVRIMLKTHIYLPALHVPGSKLKNVF